MEYGGVRLKTAAYLEKTRIPVTIDIGFGDAMTDATQRLDYPTLLDLPAPQVRCLSARNSDCREIPGDGGARRPQRANERLV
jgi:hypothetical protein